MKFWLVRKFSLDFRNILWFISKNLLSKVILKNYVPMLTSQFSTSKNIFQNNKSCGSIGNFKKMYPLLLTIATERLWWNHFLLHIRVMNGVISWYVLALYCLFHFIARLSFLSIALFFIYLFYVESTACWDTDVNKFVNTYNKVVELFLSSSVEYQWVIILYYCHWLCSVWEEFEGSPLAL